MTAHTVTVQVSRTYVMRHNEYRLLAYVIWPDGASQRCDEGYQAHRHETTAGALACATELVRYKERGEGRAPRRRRTS